MPNDDMTPTEGVEADASTGVEAIDNVQGTMDNSGNSAAAPQDKDPDVRYAYKLDTETVDEPPTDAAKDGEPQPVDEYKIEWPDGVEATPEFAALTTSAAKAAGLDGKAAGAYTAAVIDALNKAEMDNIAKTDAELKQEWGNEYQTNMKACKAFLARHAKESGLTQEDVAVLQSPKGFRLLYSFMSRTGEQAAHGTAPQAATQADKSWAHGVMHDPAHPDYKAFHDVRDARHREVNAKYNRIRFGV